MLTWSAPRGRWCFCEQWSLWRCRLEVGSDSNSGEDRTKGSNPTWACLSPCWLTPLISELQTRFLEKLGFEMLKKKEQNLLVVIGGPSHPQVGHWKLTSLKMLLNPQIQANTGRKLKISPHLDCYNWKSASVMVLGDLYMWLWRHHIFSPEPHSDSQTQCVCVCLSDPTSFSNFPLATKQQQFASSLSKPLKTDITCRAHT